MVQISVLVKFAADHKTDLRRVLFDELAAGKIRPTSARLFCSHDEELSPSSAVRSARADRIELKPAALRWCCIQFSFMLSALISPFRPCKVWRTFGILTVPSACGLFFKGCNQHTGRCSTVLFRVCARYLLPSGAFYTNSRLLACPASPRVEQEPTSKYFFLARRPCSRRPESSTLESARSPEQHSSVRTGMSMERNEVKRIFKSWLYQVMLSSGLQMTIISCFSNWWIRYTPRSSMP